MIRKLLTAVCLCIVSASAYANTTIFQPVGQVNFNGDANLVFVQGAQKWGATGCANATYVQVKADIPGRKEILSMILSAKSMGARVQFWGACDADTNYFNAFYVVIE